MARSRRTTPSAQSAVPASTAPLPTRARSTRSRTHEAAAAATQPAATTTKRGARAKSVESNASAASRASRTRKRVDAPKEIAEVDLTAVQEEDDEDEIDVNLEIPAPDGEDEAEEDAVGDRSYQTMSGTTAHEIETQETDADFDIDPHDFVNYMPNAYRTAVELLKRFDAHKPVLLQILKGIDHSDSSNATGFQQDIEAFNDAAGKLGEDFPGTLTSAEHAMRGLFKEKMPHVVAPCWRAVELIQVLNLAVLVKNVVRLSEPNERTTVQLEMLNGQVPHPFLKDINLSDSPPIVGNSYLQDETFDAVLNIRLQSAVLIIQERFGQENFEAKDLINEMFFTTPGKTETLRAWDVNGLGAGELGLVPDLAAKMRRRIRQLFRSVEDDTEDIGDGSQEGLKSLSDNFQWIDFRASIARFAKARMEEIRAYIDSAGGITKIMKEIQKELEKNMDFNADLIMKVSPYASAKKGRQTSARPSSRQPSAALSTTSPLRPTHGNTRRQQTFEPIEDIAEAEPETQHDEELEGILADNEEHERQHKENRGSVTASPARQRRLIDPQPDAVRITNFSQATQSQRSRTQPSPRRPAAGKRKRTVEETEDNVSDDEGFEQDNRVVDQSQRRRDAPRLAGNSPKKVRIEVPPASASQDRNQSRDRVREYAEQKEILASQAPRPTPVPRRALINTGRVRWAPEAELKFEEYVCDYGCSWAYIKQLDEAEDNLLEGRDQVALKDKARNMKVSFLIQGVDPLPRNWDKVPLDKKARDRLARENIDPERLERAGVYM